MGRKALISSLLVSVLASFMAWAVIWTLQDSAETVRGVGDDAVALSILNGAMRGAGDTFFAMVTGIVSFWLIRIPLATLFSRAWGREGIWWAIAASITLAFIATLIYYRTGRWKRRL